MATLWSWIKLGLVLGGVFVAMVGMFWYRTARLASFFGWEMNPDKGMWVLLAGMAMLGTGLAAFYLEQ